MVSKSCGLPAALRVNRAVLMARKPKDPHRFSYEGRIAWLTLAAVVPAIVVALVLLWFGDYSAKVQWTLTILIVGCFACVPFQRARTHHSAFANHV